MAHKFTKVLIAVEHDGKAYGVHLPADKLEQLLVEAARLSPSGSLEMYPMPNQELFALATQKPDEARFEPVKVNTAADIPWSGDDVLFIDMTDQPDREVLARIHRDEPEHEALCFIGTPPEWVSELVMTGHRVFELPAGTALQIGQRVLRPHRSSVGLCWLDVRFGERVIQLN
ncbi:TPA: hypothetical protein L4R50_000142 [Pseudomonas aeruginosa]|nr:hypothetical protein [Pseudomonas aeruginosa]